MKKSIKIIVIIFSLLLIIGASTWKIYFSSFKSLWFSPFNNIVFRMTITSSVGYPTYYYILETNGVLHYAKGLCISDDIRSKESLISTDFTGKKKLSRQNAKDIMSLLNEVEEKGTHGTSWSFGGYNVTLLYKNEVYITAIDVSKNEKLKSFSDKIRNITQMQLEYGTIH